MEFAHGGINRIVTTNLLASHFVGGESFFISFKS